MEAFLFVVTVPRADHEKLLKKNASNSLGSVKREDSTVSFDVESEITQNKFNTLDTTYLKVTRDSTNVSISTESVDNSVIEDVSSAKRVLDFNSQESVHRNAAIEMDVSSKLKKNTCRPPKNYLVGLRQDIKSGDCSPKMQNVDLDEDDISKELPMEKMVEQTLAGLGVEASAWSASARDTHAQLAFGVQGGARCERALHALRACGVGARAGSSLSVLPCALHYGAPESGGGGGGHAGNRQEIKDSAWNTFVRSVRSRMTVAQVSEQIRAGAALTFDFFFLLIVAALTAAIGLAENSTVFLVASMLISPLMGPIMAGTLGTAIHDRELRRIGVIHEIIGVLVTMAVGFVFGLVICGINENYGVGEWPTYEIMSRCDVRSLWIGALVAVPSGAAVAIAVLAGNTTSLVGVAISASLLPPAVNAGLLWAMSLVHLIFLNDDTRFTTVVKTQMYSNNPVIELAANGSISLLLTIVNIVCIFFGGVLVFMIKKVAPLNSQDGEGRFWQNDIRAVKDFNKTLHNEGDNLASTNDDGNANLKPGCYEAALEQAVAWEALRISQGEFLERLKVGGSHMTWSPAATITQRPSAYELHGRYRRLSEEPSLRKSRIRFPVNRLPNYSRLSEDMSSNTPVTEVPGPDDISEDQARTSRSKTKFIVTPVSDPMFYASPRNDRRILTETLKKY